MTRQKTKPAKGASPHPPFLINTDDAAPLSAQAPRWKLTAALCALAVIVLYLLRYDRMVGFYVDDAWYVLLGKALATGQGYQLLNSPTPGIVPFYPPGYSFLLSLAFRLAPEFPQNLPWLKAVSYLAMWGAAVATYFYFRRVRPLNPWLALGLAAVVVLHPLLVFFAASTTMSECVFTLVQLLFVLAVERCVNGTTASMSYRWLALASLLGAAMFLTRSVSVAVLFAAVLYFAYLRQWKHLAGFAVLLIVLLSPWLLFMRRHAVTPEQQAEQNNYIVYSYAEQFWHKRAGYPNQGILDASDLPDRAWENATHILEYDLGALFADPFYRAVIIGEWRLKSTLASSAWSYLVALLVLIGYVVSGRHRLTLVEIAVPLTMFITVLWPFPPVRFLLPLLPWLAFYFLLGAETVVVTGMKARVTPARLAYALVAAMLAVNLYSITEHIITTRRAGAGRAVWLKMFEENETLIRWAGKNLPPDAVMATQNPALAYLYTERKTVGSLQPAKNWDNWKRLNVRYWLQTSYYKQEPMSAAEKNYKLLYSTPELDLRVLDFGETTTRRPYQE
jgi:hypothetical protein